MSVKAEIKTATKSLVDALLSMNTANRPVKPSVVEQYSNDIASGKWMLTNQGIGISADGVLIDGQHRLEAIKAAGYPPLPVLIVSGLSDSCRMCVDSHARRTARDMLQFAFAYRVSNTAPAIATALIMHKRGRWGGSGISMQSIFDCIVEHEGEISAVVDSPKNLKFFAAAYYAGFVHCLKSGIGDAEKLKRFVSDVESGEMLTKNDPQFHLRTLATVTRSNGNGAEMRKERFEKTVKAFTAFCSGQKMGVLRA